MNKKLIEEIVNFILNISKLLDKFSIKIIDKFSINIYKPKREEEILKVTSKTGKGIKKLLKNEEDIKKEKEKGKIIKDLINRRIININNLNSISGSEYFLVIPKMHIEMRSDILGLLFREEGNLFQNSIFEYFKKEKFIDLGKRFSPIYLKNRDDLKKGYQNILIFKKILDEKIDSLLKKDNEIIKKRIEKMKGEEEIRNYFYEGDILKEDKYLFFDFMLISSVNLNKENVTLIDEKAKKDFLFRIVNQEIQEIKLKEIIINSGLKVFLNESFSSQIQKKLLKKESFIKENLRIDNFLEEINESDLKNLFEKILKEKYEEKYLKEFFKEHKLISNL